MLPDYPDIKNKLAKHLLVLLQERHKQYLGPFGQVRTTIIHEGKGSHLKREDGSEEITPFEHVEVAIEHTVTDKWTPRDMLPILDKVAQQMAEKRVKQFVTITDKAVDEVGNRLQRQPGETTTDAYFRALERVQIDCDENGIPQIPTLVVATPEQKEEFTKVLHEIYSTPSLRRRLGDILERHREAWRARESSRYLAE